MVGWLIFDDHNPEGYGTIGRAMLTLFVLLSLEGLPDQVAMGLELSGLTVLYFVTFTLLAAFLLHNILIGVVINSMEEARAIEDRRQREERRAQAAETPDEVDDREVEVSDRIGSPRCAQRSTSSRPRCSGVARAGPERPRPRVSGGRPRRRSWRPAAATPRPAR